MSDLVSPYAYLQTRDGLSLRCGHWPCPGHRPPKGTVLILQGRSEYMEKYEETVDALHNRSLDVFSFDWRGQGLSDRMLSDREKGYVRHYDDYLDDLELILEDIIRPGKRGALFLLSHSMGGHIGLRYLFRNEKTFSKAVFSAPMIDILSYPYPSYFARRLSRWQVSKGNARKAVVGAGYRTPFPDRFRGNFWTSDPERFERTRKRIKERPELSAATVTYGWVAATYDSIDILKRAARAWPLKTPLLFASGGRDRIVSNRAIRKFVADAGNCSLIEIKNARHEILQESDHQRCLFWQAYDGFMGL